MKIFLTLYYIFKKIDLAYSTKAERYENWKNDTAKVV